MELWPSSELDQLGNTYNSMDNLVSSARTDYI